jgi:hypothetical protein
MNKAISILVLLVLLHQGLGQQDIDAGTIRLNALRNRSLTSPDRIIKFSARDFEYRSLYSQLVRHEISTALRPRHLFPRQKD